MRIRAVRYYTIGIVSGVLLCFFGCQTVTTKQLAEEYYNLGNTLFELEEYDRASVQYNRALTIDRNFSRAEYNLVFSYLALGRYNEARNLLDQLIDLDSENILLIETDAYADYLQGNVSQAQEKYEEILKIDPQRISVLYNLALIHYINEEYEEAEEFLENVYRNNRNDLLAVYYYAFTKDALERPAEEIRQLTQDILTQQWDDNDKLLQTGILLEKLRYFADANSAYEKIPSEASQYLEAVFRVGRLNLIAISEPQQGFDNIEQVLEDGFRNEELFVNLYNDERLLQKRQLERVFQKYEIDIQALEEQIRAQEAAEAEAEAAAAAEAEAAEAEAEAADTAEGAETEGAETEAADTEEGAETEAVIIEDAPDTEGAPEETSSESDEASTTESDQGDQDQSSTNPATEDRPEPRLPTQ